jgi:DNA polymerase III delta' subunit
VARKLSGSVEPVKPAGAGGLASYIVGHEHVVRLLETMVAHDHLPSLLFSGQSGVGKRTVALRLAQAANCEAPDARPCGVCRSCRMIACMNHPDVKLLFPVKKPRPEAEPDEVVGVMMNRYGEFALDRRQAAPDSTLQIPIDAIRWLRAEMGRPPLQARRRFVIILHAHRMMDPAANAFLKTLEEPQAQTTFILATDSPTLLLDTIRSRCQSVRFGDLTFDQVRSWLVSRGHADGEKAEVAAAMGSGSFGRALSFIEEPDDILAQSVVDYFADGTGNASASVLAAELEGVPPAVIVGTFLFLFRETLRAKLGLPSGYARRNAAVVRRAAAVDVGYLRRAVKYLSGRSADCRLAGINQKLFCYTLISALRPPSS